MRAWQPGRTAAHQATAAARTHRSLRGRGRQPWSESRVAPEGPAAQRLLADGAADQRSSTAGFAPAEVALEPPGARTASLAARRARAGARYRAHRRRFASRLRLQPAAAAVAARVAHQPARRAPHLASPRGCAAATRSAPRPLRHAGAAFRFLTRPREAQRRNGASRALTRPQTLKRAQAQRGHARVLPRARRGGALPAWHVHHRQKGMRAACPFPPAAPRAAA